MRLTFPKTLRIRKSAEYARMRAQGATIYCGAFNLVWAQAQTSAEHTTKAQPYPTRMGVIASRRVGNSVARSKAKRMVREVFRKHQHSVPKGLELVIITRNGITQRSFADIEARFLKALTTLQKNL